VKKVVIFGAAEMARLVHFYFSRDQSREVVAFTVNREFNTGQKFCGLDVIDFEDVLSRFPPSDYDMFIAIGPSKMNTLREEKVLEAKKLGYELASYVSPHAICDSSIGQNSFLADFAVVNPFSVIGENNFVFEFAVISNESVVGNNCYISPRATVGTFSAVGNNSFLGTASVINTRVVVGEYSLVGATCYISSNTAENSAYGQKQSMYLGNVSQKINVSS
jgi:sugar O-acyltransferase (sialic acid O-acetyltransferase NeuD family)